MLTCLGRQTSTAAISTSCPGAHSFLPVSFLQHEFRPFCGTLTLNQPRVSRWTELGGSHAHSFWTTTSCAGLFSLKLLPEPSQGMRQGRPGPPCCQPHDPAGLPAGSRIRGNNGGNRHLGAERPRGGHPHGARHPPHSRGPRSATTALRRHRPRGLPPPGVERRQRQQLPALCKLLRERPPPPRRQRSAAPAAPSWGRGGRRGPFSPLPSPACPRLTQRGVPFRRCGAGRGGRVAESAAELGLRRAACGSRWLAGSPALLLPGGGVVGGCRRPSL